MNNTFFVPSAETRSWRLRLRLVQVGFRGSVILGLCVFSHALVGELSMSGDGDFEADDVGFTVYRGHPYCEACHVRLRLPKCKRCKRSIRDGDEAVEALGGKWCWGCFVCTVSVVILCVGF